MMSVVLLLLIIVVSLVIIRIAAVALELTGLPWEHAKFQALSAFTNAGFTTRESEEIVSHPVRRRIAGYLIVTGNAGLITTVGAFASSLMHEDFLLSLTNIGLITAGLSLIVWVARRRTIGSRLKSMVERRLAKRYGLRAVTADELLHLSEGYTLSRVTITKGSPLLRRSIGDLALERDAIDVLGIERGSRFMPVPSVFEQLTLDDRLVLYGPGKAIETRFHPSPLERIALVTDLDEAVAP